eukprot:TRINITY_DN22209_c0_g1_i1.p2 TRINITY_DN22209_c0_g1~~TRINITY_DN22209_c0_g1_i1.p2  ORF type:complete len:113 (+),score=19.77 TRINITY_DN22209_c0_g1_i1:205-543(+)
MQYTSIGDGHVALNHKYLEQCEQRRRAHGLLQHHSRERLAKAVGPGLDLGEIEFVVWEKDVVMGVESCMEAHNVDMVVLGSKGDTGLRRLVYRSLAHHLLHQSKPFALLVTH